MSFIQDPCTKKQKSLKRDHRTFVWEGNKSFRGLWQKKKRALAKQERCAADSILKLPDGVELEDIESPRRQVPFELHKTGVVSLKDCIEIKKCSRPRRFSLK